jgi:hypothetical protein
LFLPSLLYNSKIIEEFNQNSKARINYNRDDAKMNQFIVFLLVTIAKIQSFFSKNPKEPFDLLTIKVQRVPCQFESRRYMIHESGKEQTIIACHKFYAYPIMCTNFNKLCSEGLEAAKFKNEGNFICKKD